MGQHEYWQQVCQACSKVLTSAKPMDKTRAAREAASLVETIPAGRIVIDAVEKPYSAALLPKRPARPHSPILVPPGAVPRRRLGSVAGRVALLHAVAHIEFNAIDLAFDMALRFTPAIAEMKLNNDGFLRGWVAIGREEAEHFSLIEQRLNTLDSQYGNLPAHDGLWETAEKTASDVLSRLAIAPMVLEARGLDVTPAMIEKFEAHGDRASAAILQRIYEDEIGHVATGSNWFKQVCSARGIDPTSTFQKMVKSYFPAGLKSPFNEEGRSQAGIDLAFYAAWKP